MKVKPTNFGGFYPPMSDVGDLLSDAGCPECNRTAIRMTMPEGSTDYHFECPFGHEWVEPDEEDDDE